MDDQRIWAFEDSLWRADPDHYRTAIDDACLMVVPAPPFVMTGGQAADAMMQTPRWAEVTFSAQRVSRPREGVIVIAYRVQARRGASDDRAGGESAGENRAGENRSGDYEAHCTSTYLRHGHDDWRVIQHQQTPPLVSAPA